MTSSSCFAKFVEFSPAHHQHLQVVRENHLIEVMLTTAVVLMSEATKFRTAVELAATDSPLWSCNAAPQSSFIQLVMLPFTFKTF